VRNGKEKSAICGRCLKISRHWGDKGQPVIRSLINRLLRRKGIECKSVLNCKLRGLLPVLKLQSKIVNPHSHYLRSMKPTFPAMYSTLSPEALALLIAEKYALQNVQCSFITRGVGDTYIVETPSAKYAFRVYRATHRSLPQIEAEVALLTSLKDAAVSVSYPIEDAGGNIIQSLDAAEGTRHAVLFSYAQGVAVAALNNRQLTNLGVEMAKFHNVSSAIKLNNSRWQFDAYTKLINPLKMAEQYFATCPDEYAWLKYIIEKVQRYFDGVDTSAFSTGYCHFDFLPKNFHFDADDNITIFDFDFFGKGWLVNDVMSFWQHLYMDVYFKRMTQEAANDAYATFIHGYRTVRAISDEELATVPYLSIDFWLFYMGFHTTHEQFYAFIQPAQLKLRTALLKQLVEKHWETKYY